MGAINILGNLVEHCGFAFMNIETWRTDPFRLAEHVWCAKHTALWNAVHILTRDKTGQLRFKEASFLILVLIKTLQTNKVKMFLDSGYQLSRRNSNWFRFKISENFFVHLFLVQRMWFSKRWDLGDLSCCELCAIFWVIAESNFSSYIISANAI